MLTIHADSSYVQGVTVSLVMSKQQFTWVTSNASKMIARLT